MSDAFENLLEQLVAGSGHLGLDDVDCPPFPRELGLEPLGVIARGGSGWVFKARDPVLDREVAVKLSRPELGRAAADRILNEARITARLNHARVLPVHQALDLGDRACVVYRMAPTLTLQRLLHGSLKHLTAKWSTTARLRMVVEGTSAIARAHELGIVHGDLHPANIAIGPDGEPYLLDWGGITDATGAFTGHPAYAAPEQLAGEPPSFAGDVYAVAAMGWEVFSLRSFRPHRPEETLGEWINRLREDPAPALAAADLDPALAEVMERCFAPDPADRPSASDYVRALNAVLTGRSERRRRREEADRRVDACQEGLDTYRDLAERVAAEQKVAAVQKAKLLDHAPFEQKRPLLETRDRIRRLMVEQELAWLTAVEDGLQGITLAPDDARGRQSMADLWWARFRQAEAGSSPALMAMSLSRIEEYDDGRHLRLLAAPAHLSLACDVPGARATICQVVNRAHRLAVEPTSEHALPLTKQPLTPGSWLLRVSAPGFPETTYALALRRREHHRGSLRLFTADQIGAGWVFMPGSAFHMGGDPLARLLAWRVGGRGPLQNFAQGGGDPHARLALESCTPTIGDRFVMRYPVTAGEWLTWLNALPTDEARDRAPGERLLADGMLPYWHESEDGWALPEGWDARWPVMGVSAEDAEAYAAWRGEQEGRSLRLPTEEEWEKAARGVDGRAFPWGQDFDPTYAHMRRSRPGPAAPGAVGAFPMDSSVWGCMDMSGCIREWTGSSYGEGQRVVRGGSWQDEEDELRLASRGGLSAESRTRTVGFRLVSESPRPTSA